MPKISELPLLERPVTSTDQLLIQTETETVRIPATSFRGEQGIPGTQAGIRSATTLITPTLATAEHYIATITLAPTFEALSVTTSAKARVRLYSTAAAQAADLTRLPASKPTAGTGVILDVRTDAPGTLYLDPHAHGSSMEQPPTSAIPVTINNDDTDAAVTITIEFIPKET